MPRTRSIQVLSRPSTSCCVFLTAALFALAGPAHAGSVRTQFDLAATTIDVASVIGAIAIPPNGTVMGTFSTLAHSAGTGTASIVDGMMAITSVDLHIDVDVSQFGANITGTVDAEQGAAIAGWAYGMLTVTGANGTAVSPVFDIDGDALTPSVGTLLLRTETHLACSGFLCGLAGNFPVDSTVTDPLTKSAIVNVNNVNVPGSASITGDLTLDVASASATESTPAVVHLVGQEISRSVPEPGAVWMWIAGVAGLKGLSRLRGGA